MPLVDLNLDLGELPSEPAELYGLATVVSIACGGHAGGLASMARAISFAMARGTKIAARPSYPEGANAGEALAGSIEQQCKALQSIARKLGFPAAIVKPHGALYHDAASDPAIARALLDGAARGLGREDLTVVGPPQGALLDEAKRRGVRYAREGFADRASGAEGTLIVRITDRAVVVRQAVALASSGTIEVISVHADTAGAALIAGDVREALIQNGYLAGNL